MLKRFCKRRNIKSLYNLVGAFLFLWLTACAQNPVTGKQDFVLLNEDSELAIGRANHSKIIAQYGYYEDEALQQYVQAVGEKLAMKSHRPNLVYRFTILDSPVVNAFALPGGYIYITRGLMAYLNSEAQLAAVLGHEIGHVTARHGVRQQSAAQAANLGYTLGAILLPELRAAPSRSLFNILGGALLSGYGREHELEADRLGAEYLARAGYDPQAMIDVIKILKAQELFAAAQAKKQGRKYQGYHGLFATHPDNDTRLHHVVNAAQKFQTATKKVQNRAIYLHKIDGLVFGDSEAQGIRSGRHFYHRIMNFVLDFPENWYLENHPDSLQAIAPNGEALIDVRVADINRKLTPEAFITRRLGVDNLRQGRVLNANGLRGYTGLIRLRDGKTARMSVVFLRDKAFIFLATTKDASRFVQFDQDFLQSAASLHPLREDEKRWATALKIEVVRVKKGDSYVRWAQHSRISNSPLAQLKLINGDYPDGELKPGELAKRVK